jgi:hypothetical protein
MRTVAASLAGTGVGTALTVALAAAPAWAQPEDGRGLVPGTPCTTTARACIDLITQRAWLIKDGTVLRGPVPITSGGPSQETPQGDFKVAWKDPNHVSDNVARSPMPYSVFFAQGGVALHGGSLTRASAGCVHLDQADAIAFYQSLRKGDRVQVRAPIAEADELIAGAARERRADDSDGGRRERSTTAREARTPPPDSLLGGATRRVQ